MYLWYNYYSNAEIASFLWIKFSSFHLLASFLNLYIFKAPHDFLHSSIYARQKTTSLLAYPRDTPQSQSFCYPVSRSFPFLQVLYIQLNEQKPLVKHPWIFSCLKDFHISYSESYEKCGFSPGITLFKRTDRKLISGRFQRELWPYKLFNHKYDTSGDLWKLWWYLEKTGSFCTGLASVSAVRRGLCAQSLLNGDGINFMRQISIIHSFVHLYWMKVAFSLCSLRYNCRKV